MLIYSKVQTPFIACLFTLQVEGAAICRNIWQDDFQSLSFHYIDVNYQLKSFVISSQQIDTSDHTSIRDSIQQIAGLDVSKTELVSVTDNADGQVSCVANTLQLMIDDCLHHEDPTWAEIFSKCQALSNLTREDQQKVKKMCERLGYETHAIAPVIPTWKSMSLFMDSIIQMKEPLINLALDDPDFKESVPTEEQLEIIAELLKVFESFDKAIEELSLDKAVTLHLVVVELFNLNDTLEKVCNDSKIPAVKEWARFAKKKLDKSLPAGGCLNKYFALGNYFNSFYKGAMCFTKADYFIRRLLQDLAAETVSGQVFICLKAC